MSSRNVWLCTTGLLVAMVNFAIFYWVAARIGGDALHGYAKDGRYFLARSQGPVTEVSRAVYTYSKWHTTSVLVTHPIGIVCFVILYFWCKNIVKTQGSLRGTG